MSAPSIDEYLTAVNTALSNLQADAALHTPLAAYGYDAAAHTAYIRHLALARVVYEHEVGRTYQLGLSGRRARNHAGWVGQARQFYIAALNDPTIQTELAAVGITPASLQAGQDLVAEAAAAWLSKETEAGEAKAATQTRNAALKVLQEAYSNLIAIARVAFADDLQKLERMGIVVRGGD